MTKLKSAGSTLVGFALLGLGFWASIEVLRWAWSILTSVKAEFAIGVISAVATVLAATTAVMLGRHYERKKEIEAHFRADKIKMFDDFLTRFFELFHKSGESGAGPTVEFLQSWKQKLILWSGPEVLTAYVQWESHLKRGIPDIKTVQLMEAFFRALRVDIGQNVRGLPSGTFARLILREGELFTDLAKMDPSVLLENVGKTKKATAS